jgi:histidinol-phosphatase (PHP family)
MFDSHLHSSFSSDSDMALETACEKSIELELEGICITDHLDYDFPDFDVNFLIDFDRYSERIDNLKEKYKKRLKVLKGIEVGIQPQVIKESEELVSKYDFDFVIASIHIIERLDPYGGTYYIGKSKYEAYLRYLKEILYSVINFSNFDVVGHIGYIRRYGDYDDRSLRYSDYSDVLDSILKETIYRGKGIEVNSSGLRQGLNSPIPDLDIIKRYRELGGEIITIGSDAHRPSDIADSFKYVSELLKEAGFKYSAHFEKRKPVFDVIL